MRLCEVRRLAQLIERQPLLRVRCPDIADHRPHVSKGLDEQNAVVRSAKPVEERKVCAKVGPDPAVVCPRVKKVVHRYAESARKKRVIAVVEAAPQLVAVKTMVLYLQKVLV